MSVQTSTRGQIERRLSQTIQSLYRNQLGHHTGKVTCQLADEKLTIVIESSVTQPELLLADDGETALAQQVRASLTAAMRPQIKAVIEQVLSINVLDLLGEAVLATGRTGIIAILESSPQLRVAAQKSINLTQTDKAEPQTDPSEPS